MHTHSNKSGNPSDPNVEEDLRKLFAHRPMISMPITNTKDKDTPGRQKKASVVSFFQDQHEDESTSLQLHRDEVSHHPSLADLMTNPVSTPSELFRGFDLLSETHSFSIRPTTISEFLFASHKNKYEVLNSKGSRIFLGMETKDLDIREQGCWFGARQIKPFNILVMNFIGAEVMRIEGEPGFCGGGKTARFYRNGQKLGRVEQDNDFGSTYYQIFNEKDVVVFCVKGPSSGCCGNSLSKTKSKLEFDITTKDGTFHLGKISKRMMTPFSNMNIAVASNHMNPTLLTAPPPVPPNPPLLTVPPNLALLTASPIPGNPAVRGSPSIAIQTIPSFHGNPEGLGIPAGPALPTAFGYFGVEFYSKEIDIKAKALVLATLFLLTLEFINFESP